MKKGRIALFVALAMALISSMAGAMSREEEAEINRAGLLIEERRPAEALALLDPLLAANPDLPGVRYQAALAAQMTGDGAKASKLAAEAMQRKEETSELQVLVGVLAMQEKKFPEAEKAFARAVELNPSNGIALYNLSEALREQGRPREAIEMLQRAKEIDPKRKLLALKIRLAQLEAGENLDEIELGVVTRQSEDDQTEDWLMTAAAVHLKDGNYRQAIEALRTARGVMGLDNVRAVFSDDRFFRQFSADEQMAEFREEIGLQ
jgi:tetratricopeptide (TPR) repeat protein